MDEATVDDILSGRRRGIGPSVLRSGLFAASQLYLSATSLRNIAYDRQWLKIHRASVPVISIGNISTGGTGKTPFAAWIANWLVDSGQRPAFLSRGYRALQSADPGRTIENDEKLVLDRLCPGVPHLQKRDRVRSALQAVNEFDCNLLLLDDGFQHRRLHRDLDIVLIDALRPFGYGYALPRGLLREALSGLKRADLVVLTRFNQASPIEQNRLLADLGKIGVKDAPITVAFTPQRLININGDLESLDQIRGKKVIGFCGIGNPQGFRKTLYSLEVVLADWQVFPDHHHYGINDINQIAKTANETNVDAVLTTQKDLVKITPPDWKGPPLHAVEIGVEFLSGREKLETQLKNLIPA
jgi:tetraacyldisaccharide 4'-kinase